jgi:hypothetical protein
LKHLFDVMYLMYCSAEFMPVTKFDISWTNKDRKVEASMKGAWSF